MRAGEVSRGLIDAGFAEPLQIRARFTDQVGRKYESRPFDIDPREWASRL